MSETCAECGVEVICGHSISIDNGRRTWRICCLCAAALIAKLDGAKAQADS